MIQKLSAEVNILKWTWRTIKYIPLAFTSWVVFCSLWFEQTSDVGGRIAIILCWLAVLGVMSFPYGSGANERLVRLIDRSLLANFILVVVIFGGQLVAPRIFNPYAALALGGISKYRVAVKREEAMKYASTHCKIHDQKTSDNFDHCWDTAYAESMAKQ